MKLHGGKEWFTAAELAELALAGLPTTKRKINERAAEERWAIAVDAKGMPLARPRQARGGGLEYHLTLLPPATRSALAGMGVAVVANVSDEPPVQASQLWRWYEGAGERVQSEAHRRLAVVQLVDTLVAAGMTRSAAVPAAAKDQGVGVSTLWGWLGLVDGVALADRLSSELRKALG